MKDNVGMESSAPSENGQSQNEEFVRLLLLYQKRIYGFILAMVPNYADAEDLFQQVVMIMCRRFGDFEPGTSFLAWALQIARYELNNIRKTQRRSRVQFSSQTMDMLFEQACRQVSGIDQRIGVLEECLKKLEPADRALVYRRYEQGMKIKEIAQQVGRSVYSLYRGFNRIHLFLRHCVNTQLEAERGKS
jgi:RNA polymerase sigma-70 factor (ECF subfamily)